MNPRLPALRLALCAALFATAAAAQQRIEFQRQKFDRSRFERAGQSVAPAPAPAAPAAEPVGTLPPPAPAAMPTEAPTSPASSVFSYSNTPSAGSYATTAPATAPTGTAIFAADAVLPAGPAPGTYPANATPEEKALIDAPLFDQIPPKWADDADEYPALLDLQKKTGACLLVYVRGMATSDQKGRCSWVEKSILGRTEFRRAAQYYLKFELTLPGNDDVRALAEQLRVKNAPALFVIKPGSTMPGFQPLFDKPRPGAELEILDVETVLGTMRNASTPAYQNLF